MMNFYTLGIWQETTGSDAMSVPQSILIAVIGIAVVLVELALISLFIKVLSAIIQSFSKKKAGEPAPADAEPAKAAAPAAPAPAAPAGVSLPETESEGTLDLVNVDEPTAACIMAIVSNESGIPLNRLAFKSIKLVEDK